ncbi:MAG: histidine-type phosphatase [Deltaproteobacteria bacterium]|nr:histidine-type phosphatase [Deltaproteobacteria bacterium]
MKIFKRMVFLLCLVLALSLLVEAQALAQIIRENDGTTLKQIIIFGRHNIRSPTNSPEELAKYAVDPYPEFEVPPGCLTPNGKQAARLLGAYFRQYLLAQGLLTGDEQQDLSHSHFRSKSKERSWETAKAFGSGLITNVDAPVHSYKIGEPDRFSIP